VSPTIASAQLMTGSHAVIIVSGHPLEERKWRLIV
jgi:hypothetical protein